MMRPVRLDGPQRRRGSTVAWCEECPSWREVFTTRPAALRAAATHLHLVHDQVKRAGDLRDLAARQERDTPRPRG